MECIMRLPIALAACLAFNVAALPASAGQAGRAVISQIQPDQDFSAAKRKKAVRGYQAYGSGGQQIACTYLGCHPIPRGCRIQTGRIPFTWEPSGYDDVVCPYR
jgi:hypothetical protein